MTPALRSRLEAERMFTAKDLVEAAADGFAAGGAYSAMHIAGADNRTGGAALQAYADQVQETTLARVQAHLSSDTTRIRPKRQG